jgi:DNA-binding YbaB/EbfC family protein
MSKGKGFGGMPANMGNLMKQAQQMQADMQKLQAEADLMSAEGNSGGGLVKVICSGKNQVLSIEIDAKAIDPNDKEMLQDLLVSAVNQALNNVQEMVRGKMEKITGGMGGIPGLF